MPAFKRFGHLMVNLGEVEAIEHVQMRTVRGLFGLRVIKPRFVIKFRQPWPSPILVVREDKEPQAYHDLFCWWPTQSEKKSE